MSRTPKVIRSASRTLPADSTVATAEYKFGVSGDQSAGFGIDVLAAKLADPSAETDCGAESAAPTTLPTASRICQRTRQLSPCVPWFCTTVARLSVAAPPLIEDRIVLSQRPRCSASVLVSHTCR